MTEEKKMLTLLVSDEDWQCLLYQGEHALFFKIPTRNSRELCTRIDIYGHYDVLVKRKSAMDEQGFHAQITGYKNENGLFYYTIKL